MLQNLADASVRVLGYCLMSNHIHWIAVPAREDSLSILARRVHGRYAQYYNARCGRSGHLWQNRFFGCMLGPGHLIAALAYVERNPVRAGMVQEAAAYPWSSAAAHLTGIDESGLLDMAWWRANGPEHWAEILRGARSEPAEILRRCTYSGRPYGDENFVSEMANKFGRSRTRGRPRKEPARKDSEDSTQSSTGKSGAQFSLFLTNEPEK